MNNLFFYIVFGAKTTFAKKYIFIPWKSSEYKIYASKRLSFCVEEPNKLGFAILNAQKTYDRFKKRIMRRGGSIEEHKIGKMFKIYIQILDNSGNKLETYGCARTRHEAYLNALKNNNFGDELYFVLREKA